LHAYFLSIIYRFYCETFISADFQPKEALQVRRTNTKEKLTNVDNTSKKSQEQRHVLLKIFEQDNRFSTNVEGCAENISLQGNPLVPTANSVEFKSYEEETIPYKKRTGKVTTFLNEVIKKKFQVIPCT